MRRNNSAIKFSGKTLKVLLIEKGVRHEIKANTSLYFDILKTSLYMQTNTKYVITRIIIFMQIAPCII